MIAAIPLPQADRCEIPAFSVTPAKAGVQGHTKLRLRPWIPAFAGMTF
jgi:hypothetical protein